MPLALPQAFRNAIATGLPEHHWIRRMFSRPAPERAIVRGLSAIAGVLPAWLAEPIGAAVTGVALVLLLLVPQMPDMFAGMRYGISDAGLDDSFIHPLGLGASSLILGFQAWYWMRAALLARRRTTDAVWFSIREASAEEWAPRVLLLLSAVLSCTPLLHALLGDLPFADVSWLSMGASILLLTLLLFFLINRRDIASLRWRWTPAFLLRTRPTALLAGAPFGWVFALFLLGVSAAGVMIVGKAPGFVERNLHTPTAALLALALVIGPLAMALQIARTAIDATGRLTIAYLRWRGYAMDGVGEYTRRWPEPLGVLLLLLLLYVPSGAWQDPCRARMRMIDGDGAATCRFAEPPADTPDPRPTLDTALLEWAERHPAPAEGRETPVIIVAAEGGASRAAVALLATLRMLDARTSGMVGRHLFAISSVSGGSLGAVTYMMALKGHARSDGSLNWDDEKVTDGLRELARGDLLAASIATYFLNDTLARIAGPFWPYDDRGIALEHGFERHWTWTKGFAVPAERTTGGLLAAWRDSPSPPHLLLNGTDIESGGRVITSTLAWTSRDDLFSNSVDLLGELHADVPAATAVTNSARFPFISPTGTAGPAGRADSSAVPRRQILDGGIFENYGARTAAELARQVRIRAAALKLKLRPVVIVIGDDADLRRDSVPPTLDDTIVTCAKRTPKPLDAATVKGRNAQSRGALELLAPLLGLLSSRQAHGADALTTLARNVCGPDDETALDGLMTHFDVPLPQGAEVAPMNWVQSPEACDFIVNKTPQISYNAHQAGRLAKTLAALTGTPVNGRPLSELDCIKGPFGTKQAAAHR
jgi:hypothetical protein